MLVVIQVTSENSLDNLYSKLDELDIDEVEVTLHNGVTFSSDIEWEQGRSPNYYVTDCKGFKYYYYAIKEISYVNSN